MSSPRVALLTPCFWPVANQRLASASELAEAWQACGAEVTVFSERLEPDWSSRIRIRELEVRRIERPPARPWSRGRFGKALVRALAEQPLDLVRESGNGDARPWDAIVVFDWPEALQALDGASNRLTNRLLYWLDRPLPQLIGRSTQARSLQLALKQCAGILSPHSGANRWLAEFGGDHPEIFYLPETGTGEDTYYPQAEIRESARKTLAELHPLLNFERNQLVGLCAAELSGDSGMFDLLTSWRHLRREEPRAQLVVVGEGAQARALWARIYDWHLQGNVIMPGCFDELSDLLQAADFYVHPLRNELTCPALSKALAVGIPSLVSRSTPLAEPLVHGQDAWLFSPGNTSELSNGLREIATQPAKRLEVGKSGASAVPRASLRATQQQVLKSLLGTVQQDVTGVVR